MKLRNAINATLPLRKSYSSQYARLKAGRESVAARMRCLTTCVLLACCGVLASTLSTSSAAQSTSGQLDTSFGTQGRAVVFFRNNTRFGFGDNAEAYAVAVQPDGKIVAAGRAAVEETSGGFALARLNTDGTPDATFGHNGQLTTRVLGNNDEAYAVKLQPDGKIVVAGTAYAGTGTTYEFALVRYHTDGTLDASFGAGGKVTTDFGGDDVARAVLLQPDGKIVAVGFKINELFALARYNTDGSLDATFGAGGRVVTNFGSLRSQAYAAVLQPDGKIVAAGDAHSPLTTMDFALARYLPNGALDPTFGIAGLVTTDFGRTFSDYARGVEVQPDGRIVAAGWAENNCTSCGAKSDVALARYLPTGALDSSFGTGGRVVTDASRTNGHDRASGVAVQPDGRIVVSGTAPAPPQPGGSHPDMAVLRYLPTGALDQSFGEQGRTLIDFGIFNPPEPPTYGSGLTGDEGHALALQPDGRIVVVGQVLYHKLRKDFGIARLLGD